MYCCGLVGDMCLSGLLEWGEQVPYEHASGRWTCCCDITMHAWPVGTVMHTCITLFLVSAVPPGAVSLW